MSWQDKAIQKLNLDGAFIYIVNDPDGLCFEPTITSELQRKGSILFDDIDPFALRLTYERWRNSTEAKTLLVRMTDSADLFIPYDIFFHAKYIDFHLSEVCPDLDISVLRLIPAAHYQTVIDAVSTYRPGILTRQASEDFLLRHVYRIAPEIIQSNTDLVRLLIRKHYIGIEMPVQLEQRLIELLSLNSLFKKWDFQTLLPDRTVFFDFLQEQWLLYLGSELNNVIASSKWPENQLMVPFADSDVRVFIDNLFADGILKPVDVDGLPLGHWGWVGVKKDSVADDTDRICRLLKNAQSIFKQPNLSNMNAEFWCEQSHLLGIMNALFYQNIKQPTVQLLCTDIKALNCLVDSQFETWIQCNFAKLLTKPTVRYPTMLHRIPDWLSRRVNNGKKVCLLVFDGMGARQWPLLRSQLQKCQNISIDEHSCFAWVPTITSISRQALFSGKRPFAFADSLLTTSKEEQLWRNFWLDQGLAKREVTYAKNVETLSIDEWQDLFASPALKSAGFVINFIDEQMHGIKMGIQSLNMVVDAWLDQCDIKERISILLDRGFEIIITADHGNQEAIGTGIIKEGIKAETRGERVRIYTDETLRDSSTKSYKGSVIAWPGPALGLPQATYPLLAGGDSAFKNKGETIVGHGGISLHEVVVPFIIINRKQ